MSNLKYLSVHELKKAKRECKQNIDLYSSKVNGQRERLKWIEKYIHEKTPVELTIEEIEQKLGHKVIIK